PVHAALRLPPTTTFWSPSFRYRIGGSAESHWTHCGAAASGKNAPEMNAIGIVTMLLSPAAPGPVLAIPPSTTPIARNIAVPSSTSGTANHVHADNLSPIATATARRSEEHTSELQSREHLVCRRL